MKKENAGFLFRACAFIIDMFIIAFVASLLSMPFVDSDSTEKISKQVNELVEKASKKEISMQTYTTELRSLTYQNDRINGIYTIFVLVLSILYFIVYQFYTKQTIGKKIFKIKIDSNKGELTMNHMLFRGLIINSILFSLLAFVFVIFSNENTYFVANVTLNSMYYLILFISACMIIFRKDGRGLHDIICNTKVVKC
ncbi:MAG: RDD family protein [Bacilli bacterium]|nr:RDD family protein [Bacilli bacterium]MBQ6539028.1 RDD family protein [Bacilli bacterium]